MLWTRPPCQRLGGLRTSPATGHCADCHHGASSSIGRTPGEASLLWTRPPCQRLGGLRTSPATGHCADCHHGASSSIRRTQATQARQACYGRDHPVNHSEVTDPDRRTRGEARCAARPAAGQAQLAGGGVPRAAVRPGSGLRIPDTVSARAPSSERLPRCFQRSQRGQY